MHVPPIRGFPSFLNYQPPTRKCQGCLPTSRPSRPISTTGFTNSMLLSYPDSDCSSIAFPLESACCPKFGQKARPGAGTAWPSRKARETAARGVSRGFPRILAWGRSSVGQMTPDRQSGVKMGNLAAGQLRRLEGRNKMKTSGPSLP